MIIPLQLVDWWYLVSFNVGIRILPGLYSIKVTASNEYGSTELLRQSFSVTNLSTVTSSK